MSVKSKPIPKTVSFQLEDQISFEKPSPAITDPEHPEECIVNIDMLRTGKFMRSSFFGDFLLTITDDMLLKMKENFENNVVQRDIPLDVNHNKTHSYGWLKSVDIVTKKVKDRDQKYLVGQWSFTNDGQSLVKDKNYRYFSIEFTPNYEHHEVLETVKTPDGHEEPCGEMTKYGPTILGGALTNRPFIPNLDSVKLSEIEQDFPNTMHIFALSEEVPAIIKSDVVSSDNTKKDKQSTERKGLVLNLQAYKPKRENNMSFSAAQSIIQFMETQLSSMTDKESQEFKVMSDKLASAKEEFELASKEKSDAELALKKANTKNEELSKQFSETITKVVDLENRVKENESEISLERERRRQSEINEFCNSLMSKGYPKGVQSVVKEILLADKESKQVITLSSDGKSVGLNMRDVVAKLLSAFPEDAKIPAGEITKTESQDKPAAGDSASEFTEKYKEAIERGTKRGLSVYSKRKSQRSE